MTWPIATVAAITIILSALLLRRHPITRRFHLTFKIEFDETAASPPTDASSTQSGEDDSPG